MCPVSRITGLVYNSSVSPKTLLHITARPGSYSFQFNSSINVVVSVVIREVFVEPALHAFADLLVMVLATRHVISSWFWSRPQFTIRKIQSQQSASIDR